MSDYQAAGIAVGHNIYVLRAVVEDLARGFAHDANERRFIANSQDELTKVAAILCNIIGDIQRADTSQTVSRIRLDELPQTLFEAAMSPDNTREGMFRYHNCWRCRHGKLPCAQGDARTCSNPHARDD